MFSRDDWDKNDLTHSAITRFLLWVLPTAAQHKPDCSLKCKANINCSVVAGPLHTKPATLITCTLHSHFGWTQSTAIHAFLQKVMLRILRLLDKNWKDSRCERTNRRTYVAQHSPITLIAPVERGCLRRRGWLYHKSSFLAERNILLKSTRQEHNMFLLQAAECGVGSNSHLKWMQHEVTRVPCLRSCTYTSVTSWT